MFSPDIVSLRQFYSTPLGEAVQAQIAASIRELWPEAPGDTVLGIGYCQPYLDPYLHSAAACLICMPALAGAACWPPSFDNVVCLARESDLPIPDNSINRLLMLHSIEHTDHLPWMMEEIWRVLTPGGRVLAVVPNRLSFWARSSRSPFGYGRPFSMAQLRDLMTGNRFTLTRHASALFMPAPAMRWRMAGKMEHIGKLLFPFMGGVLIVEAEKQIYASVKQPVSTRKAYVPIPATTPAMGLKMLSCETQSGCAGSYAG